MGMIDVLSRPAWFNDRRAVADRPSDSSELAGPSTFGARWYPAAALPSTHALRKTSGT